MTCHNCGGGLENLITSLPFKLSDDCIAIIRGLPILQCRNCSEYVIEDQVMEKIDIILGKIDTRAFSIRRS